MAKKAYAGVSSIARNVSKIYAGVNGVARKVIKGYVGVNGVARQFWGNVQYLNTWSAKTWSGFVNIDGRRIWTDGTDYYYSYESDQYVLDKTTSTWSTKTWNGYSNLTGSSIWTDGTNIYYSASTKQYVLDKSTDTWSDKTWNGYTSLIGGAVSSVLLRQSWNWDISRIIFSYMLDILEYVLFIVLLTKIQNMQKEYIESH